MLHRRLIGEVRFVFAWPHAADHGRAEKDARFVEMATATATVAVESRDLGIAPLVNGSGVTCNDGGHITMIVTDDPVWTDAYLTNAAKVLGERLYAKLGTSIEAQREHERLNDYTELPLFKWCWTKKWPCVDERPEYVRAA